MWRKNRRNNGGSYGVDNNRNMPFGWTGWSCSGSTTGSSETYRGPNAGSEPETQTVMALMRDRNPAKVLDIHSAARDVRINYAASPPNGVPSLPQAIDTLGVQIAQGLATQMNYVQVRAGACGTIASHASHAFGAMSFLIETGRVFQPPAAEMREELVRVYPGLEWYLALPLPIAGHVVDAATGQGVAADIEMPDAGFNYEERRQTMPGTGRFHLWAPVGTHRVTASAPGYTASTVAVDVADGATASVEIRLTHQ